MILDEPTASLDAESKSHIYSILDELNKDMTIIMVTHDMSAISSHVHTIACLNKELHYHGHPELSEETIHKLYGCPIDLIAHGIPHRVLKSTAIMEVIILIRSLFEYQFLQNAVISAILASIACGIIGTIIIEKRLVMMSGGIAHTAFGGIGLGYLLGIEPIIGALFITICAAMGIATIKRKTTMNTDIPIGIFWAAGMSLGILFIALTPGYPPDMTTYLLGIY